MTAQKWETILLEARGAAIAIAGAIEGQVAPHLELLPSAKAFDSDFGECPAN